MKYISEFRELNKAKGLLTEIQRISDVGILAGRNIRIMEVCGGHTMAIHKYGLPSLLPQPIELLSGPGCPVCVTANSFIDRAIALARREDVMITSFGDMLRVPGSSSSLLQERGKGADVRICYSSLDALELARKTPDKKVVFLGIGFETTAPTIAAAIHRAQHEGMGNFFVLNALKTMPSAMKALLEGGELRLDAFICPGHVSVVTGLSMYQPIADQFSKPCVVTGFEPLDLLQAILMICRQIAEGRHEVENQYSRAASWEGNALARDLIERVFEPDDVAWRGLGTIPGSGLKIRPEYGSLDATIALPVEVEVEKVHPGCICGSVMRGVKRPSDCKLFGKVCTPEDPKGACMVSDEGTCATFFKYRRPM